MARRELLLYRTLQRSRAFEQINKIAANNPNAAEALKDKLSGLKKVQKTAEKIIKTNKGTIKYYLKFRKARVLGLTTGARFVTEYNPKTGDVIQWNETYDKMGNVNRIHLKSINGIEINSPHFPLTLREKLDRDFIPTF